MKIDLQIPWPVSLTIDKLDPSESQKDRGSLEANTVAPVSTVRFLMGRSLVRDRAS